MEKAVGADASGNGVPDVAHEEEKRDKVEEEQKMQRVRQKKAQKQEVEGEVEGNDAAAMECDVPEVDCASAEIEAPELREHRVSGDERSSDTAVDVGRVSVDMRHREQVTLAAPSGRCWSLLVMAWVALVTILAAPVRFFLPGFWVKDPVERHAVFAEVFAVLDEPGRRQFPGKRREAKVALCFSGGGSRSLSAAMGQYRALEALGVLPGNVDAISSVSGGTWASAQYMFATRDARTGRTLSSVDLLGKLTRPEDLNMTVLERTPPMMGATANVSTNSFLRMTAFAEQVPVQEARVAWIELIGKTFLGPYGLHGRKYMAASEASVRRIAKANPMMDPALVSWATPRPDRPPTFVMNGVLLAPVGYRGGYARNMVSLQMSPDVTGSPFYPLGGLVSYIPCYGIQVPDKDEQESPAAVLNMTTVVSVGLRGGHGSDKPQHQALKDTEEIRMIVGGGFVETFAFGSCAPSERRNGGMAKLQVPKEPFTLSEAIGISSWAPASRATQLCSQQKWNPTVSYWAVTSEHHEAVEYQLGDGGSLENLGALAMLQSGVTKLVVFINTYVPLKPWVVPDGLENSTGDIDLTNVASTDLSCLFGHCAGVDTTDYVYSNNQVFPRAFYAPLLRELWQKVVSGEPASAYQRLPVLQNNWWGIQGGNHVEIVWVYNERLKSFESRLPADTRCQLEKKLLGPFARFPFYKTLSQNPPEFTSYTMEQVNLLAAQAEFAVLQSRDLICRLVHCALAGGDTNGSRGF